MTGSATRPRRPGAGGSLSLLLGEAGNPDGSRAACDSGGPGRHAIAQYGPRRLWDEAEAACRW